MMRAHHRQAGFTLLEILVALAVLGIVLAGLAQAGYFGMVALKQQERFSAQAEQMARVDRLIRNLFENAAPPVAADDKPFFGQAHRAIIVSLLPRQPKTYLTRRGQVAFGVDEHGKLLMRWQPHANAQYLLREMPKPEQIVVLEGVDHIDLSYRKAIADGGGWGDRWDDATLPSLVHIHIEMTDKTKHWPDIVVATMIDPNGSF